MGTVTNADVANESGTVKARLAFLTWLRRTHPAVYRASVPDESGQMGGIFDSIGSAIGKIDFGKLSDGIAKAGEGIVKVGTGLLSLKQQKVLFDLNVKRVKQGLPPLEDTGFGQGPRVTTEIEISEQMAQKIRDATDAARMPLIIGAAGLAAYFLFFRRKGAR